MDVVYGRLNMTHCHGHFDFAWTAASEATCASMFGNGRTVLTTWGRQPRALQRSPRQGCRTLSPRAVPCNPPRNDPAVTSRQLTQRRVFRSPGTRRRGRNPKTSTWTRAGLQRPVPRRPHQASAQRLIGERGQGEGTALLPLEGRLGKSPTPGGQSTHRTSTDPGPMD